MTTPPQEQTTGFGHAVPVGTTPHSNTCTALVPPSTIKGEDLGHLGKKEKKDRITHTHTHTFQPLESNVSDGPLTPCRDLGLVPSLP